MFQTRSTEVGAFRLRPLLSMPTRPIMGRTTRSKYATAKFLFEWHTFAPLGFSKLMQHANDVKNAKNGSNTKSERCEKYAMNAVRSGCGLSEISERKTC